MAWKAEPRTTRGGQPQYSALAINTALTLRAVFRLTLRQTEGLIGSIIAMLGFALAVPDHITLSRRTETLEVLRSGPGTRPVHLIVDSTGLKLCGAGEWLFEKHGTRTAEQATVAMDRLIYGCTGQIEAFDVQLSPAFPFRDVLRNDGVGSIRLLGRTFEALKISHCREGAQGNVYRSVTTGWKDLAT